MGQFYVIEDVPEEVMKKLQKVIEVLEFEGKLAQEIQYAYPIKIEGYLHDGNVVGLYSYSDMGFNEIESRLLSYSRVLVPELNYIQEEFAEEWQKLQLLLMERDWVVKDLEEVEKFIDRVENGDLDKIIQEIKEISTKAIINNALYGGLII